MILFWIRETVLSIKKAQASFILSVLSTTIAVSLVVISLLLFFITSGYDKSIREAFSVNLFLKQDISDKLKENIRIELSEKEYIKSFKYLSREEAAKNFIAETGEDFTRIIDYNPLPASFEVHLKDIYVQKDSIIKIQQYLGGITGVDEVSFNADIYYKLIDYLNEIKKYILAGTLLLLFISLYLIYSTNRLILAQRYDELNTMKLIGAKLISIKMPVVLNSVIIGLIAAVLASSGLYFLNNLLKANVDIPDMTYRNLILLALITGPLLGIITSLFSLRKINLKI